MTRASLLHILDHVNGISDAEVRELEQLAAAFPYCQTAHVLLAKAAHDRGSMLASQRLRRAATYAADRELLRQLIEQPAPAAANSAEAAAYPVPAETAILIEAAALVSAPFPAADFAPAVAASSPDLPPAAPASDTLVPTAWPIPEPAAEPADAFQPAEPEILVSEQSALTAAANPEEVLPEVDPATVIASTDNADQQPAECPEAVVAEEPEVISPRPEALADQALVPDNSSEPAPAEELLPAVAPPIRPPVEAGAARFEFGLTDTSPEFLPLYQLPTLPEEDPLESSAAAAGIPAFRADAELAYALSGGSRLGYCLQLRDEFTRDLPADDFFAPDALLLAHRKAHTSPAPVPSRSSFELINKFLRVQPRLKAPAATAPPAEEQADLSVRSIQGVPEIATEMLAKIMVRQGKIDKAIEIYERLIVRQPEKKAYFAEQIQQLKPSE